jgi:outer membrane protein assembly factor BamB
VRRVSEVKVLNNSKISDSSMKAIRQRGGGTRGARWLTVLLALGAAGLVNAAGIRAAPWRGWLDWRGPAQNGTSRETGLPGKLEVSEALWVADFPGQSTPVIADDRLYINGYEGEGPELQEALACFDPETGQKRWEHRFNDFLSDTVYLRYATSSPAIDPETGNVYMQGTQGILACFTADGALLWQHSMMEEFGRMTFPNSRTASPMIDRELVITRGITSNWGVHGAAGDRLYAFDKKTGGLVWTSSPGDRPQDNTFSHPYLDWLDGQRVLYAAGGDCSLFCLNARTGQPLWRTPIAKAGAKGGINAAVVRYKDTIIIIHESENLDSSEIGRMAALRVPHVAPTNSAAGPVVLPTKAVEVWRNPIGSLASSPVLVGDRLYEVSGAGDLCAVDADTGRVLWKKKLGIEQRQSSPFYADGKLYVAMYISAEGAPASPTGNAQAGTTGDLFVIRPGETDAEILSRTQLAGRCYGSPIAHNGKVYVQTDKKLYCFGKRGVNPGFAVEPEPPEWPKPGPAAQLQVIPSEVFLYPGQKVAMRVRLLDAKGFTVSERVEPKTLKWTAYVPPTALVRATMKASFTPAGELVADAAPVPSAGAFEASLGDLRGYFRGRILPGLPLQVDFENIELSNTTTNAGAPPTPFAYPPLPWNGARFRFEVREKDGTKALTKTIDNKLFQRAQVFIGHPDLKNYTIQADVMSEGNRRKMSEVGLINQRYAIVLKGNAQELEVSSNLERLKVAVPFHWSANTWYQLKARVDVAPNGSGVVRAKAWKKGDPEPAGWTAEAAHTHAHTEGAPGLFSFAPQDQRAYIDNISVTAN